MSQLYEAYSLDDFDSSLRATVKGDRIVYYKGPHAAGAVARHAARRQREGYVTLVQRRIEGGFQYEAQRTKKRFR